MRHGANVRVEESVWFAPCVTDTLPERVVGQCSLGVVTALIRVKTLHGGGALFARVHALRPRAAGDARSAQYGDAVLVERADADAALLIPLSCIHGPCTMTHLCEMDDGGDNVDDDSKCHMKFGQHALNARDDVRMAARGIRHCAGGVWAINPWIQTNFSFDLE
jgi:hypothetical protein